jgi:hypothetical protein
MRLEISRLSYMHVIAVLALALIGAHPMWAAPSERGLSIFPDNPRYFAWEGKPIFLASKSFGWTAVSEPGFDYVRDIETAAAHGGNLLRLTLFWPSHGEEGGELPWRRDAETGQYNLDEFNPAYFARLRDYLSVARHHRTVVNLELFDHPAIKGGASRWPVHPMNPRKNTNYGPEVFDASSADRDFFQTLPEHKDNPVALRYQKALVRKVLDETLDFDNVIYSLGNECPSPAAWNEFWAPFIRSHAADKSARRVFVTNMWRHDLPIFDVFDIQDAQHPYRVRRVNAEGMWNAYRAVDTRQREQDRIKPVYDSGQMGGAPGSHILHQLWMSFVGGTAGMRYHRLAPVHPRPGISSEVEYGNWQDPFYLEQQRWVRHLRRFIEDLEFWTMQPLWDAVVEGQGYAFGRPGDEYVVYLPDGGSISLAVPAEPDLYEFYWYDPDRGGAHPPGTVSISTARNSVLTLTAPSKQDWVLHAGRHKLRPPAADRLLP